MTKLHEQIILHSILFLSKSNIVTAVMVILCKTKGINADVSIVFQSKGLIVYAMTPILYLKIPFCFHQRQ